MSWKIRHAGSPKEVSNVTLKQIAEGLQDGQWELDDEIRGPNDDRWIPACDHPALEEVVENLEAAIEAEGRPEHDPEEDRIDMNPLIDVCLVLLVFFILATTLSVMEKVLEIPEAKRGEASKLPEIPYDQVQKLMIIVRAQVKNNKPVIEVDGKETQIPELMSRFRELKTGTGKSQVVIDAKDVDWQTIVSIIDAAGGAGIAKVNFKVDTGKKGGGGAPAPAK